MINNNDAIPDLIPFMHGFCSLTTQLLFQANCKTVRGLINK